MLPLDVPPTTTPIVPFLLLGVGILAIFFGVIYLSRWLRRKG